jgi:hypothetical protein
MSPSRWLLFAVIAAAFLYSFVQMMATGSLFWTIVCPILATLTGLQGAASLHICCHSNNRFDRPSSSSQIIEELCLQTLNLYSRSRRLSWRRIFPPVHQLRIVLCVYSLDLQYRTLVHTTRHAAPRVRP